MWILLNLRFSSGSSLFTLHTDLPSTGYLIHFSRHLSPIRDNVQNHACRPDLSLEHLRIFNNLLRTFVEISYRHLQCHISSTSMLAPFLSPSSSPFPASGKSPLLLLNIFQNQLPPPPTTANPQVRLPPSLD